MNRNQAKELMPIIQAFLEGKTIERKTRSWEPNKGWRDETQWENTEELIFRDTFVYRIKPKPSYRPFANGEECWVEMQKHQPFGWVINKSNGRAYNIQSVLLEDGVVYIRCSYVELEKAFIGYIFVDGTPFGIKE